MSDFYTPPPSKRWTRAGWIAFAISFGELLFGARFPDIGRPFFLIVTGAVFYIAYQTNEKSKRYDQIKRDWSKDHTDGSFAPNDFDDYADMIELVCSWMAVFHALFAVGLILDWAGMDGGEE